MFLNNARLSGIHLGCSIQCQYHSDKSTFPGAFGYAHTDTGKTITLYTGNVSVYFTLYFTCVKYVPTVELIKATEYIHIYVYAVLTIRAGINHVVLN